MTIQPTKMAWWYSSVIDWMIQNPDKNLTDCAREFKVTPTWIYTLTKSDAFVTALKERRADHNFLLSMGVVEKAGAVAEMALDQLADNLRLKGELMPSTTVLEIADSMMARMGYGNTKGGSPVPAEVHVTIGVDPAMLEAARNRLKQVQATMSLPTAVPPQASDRSQVNSQRQLELDSSDYAAVTSEA